MTASAHDPAPLSARPLPRVDVFGPIHKAIRHALGDLLTRMGSATFSDPESAARIVQQLAEVTALCEEHRDKEERFLLPALAARLQGPLHAVLEAHAAQPRLVAELRALGQTLVATPATRRPLVGRTLYLHFSRFAAELLLHMAEEEQMVQPLLERLFSDEELTAIHARAMGALSLDEKARSARWMLPALNAAERAVLLDSARSLMSSEDFANLAARCGITT